MKCYITNQDCACKMDAECPVDPFRGMEENDEEQIHLETITGYLSSETD